MTGLEDLDVDEIADALAPEIEERIDVPEPDVPDDIPAPEDIQDIAAETAGATVQDQLEHLVHEDCDTPACNQLRDEFGIDPSGDDGDDESGSEGDESEADGDDGEGNDESSQSSETEGDTSQTGDEAESDSESSGPENVAFPDEY